MKLKYILLLCISACLSFSVVAQDEVTTTNDSLPKINKYGLRVGADISKPLRTILEDGYSGFEVMADFRLSKKFYAAVELGNEKKERIESNLNSTSSGSYAKIGFDFNAYNNWLGMNNAIHAGLRYGFSTFKQELVSYGIYTTDGVFPGDIRENPQEFSGLTAHWAEFVFGVKTEIANNLFLGINLQLKRMITEDKPDNFDNLYIPGFNRTYDFSEFGVGYGYSISYFIPIFRR